MDYIKYKLILMEKIKLINNNIVYDYDYIKKSIVNYVVIIFGFVIIMIFILLGLYYLTPNNYELIEWNNDKFKFQTQIEYVIKPNSTININTNINTNTNENEKINKYLKFPEKTNLVIKNIFKSQNIIIPNDTELIKPNYNSEIFLINNSDLEIKIIVQYYSHI